MSEKPSAQTACPTCSSPLVGEVGFVAWCAACDWNVDSTPDVAPPGRMDRLRGRVNDRLVRRMYDSLKDRPGLTATRTLSWYLTMAFAIVVHLAVLGLAGVAIWLGVSTWPNVVTLFIAGLILAIVIQIRPRLGRFPKNAIILRRTDAPALYRLLDRIATAASAKPAQVVVLDGDYNASYSGVGIRRRRVLTVGLPLWRTLTPQERIAILGHEFGHSVNGDVQRSLVVWSALSAVRGTAWFVMPDGSDANGVEWVLRPFQWAAFWMLYGVAWVLNRLAMWTSQRGEYLADEIAVRVGGSTSAASALDSLGVLGPSVENTLWATKHGEIRGGAVWAKLDERIKLLPDSERERRRRKATKGKLRVDVTHPPNHLRVSRIAALPPTEPQVTISAADGQAIEAELARPYEGVADQIVEDALNGRYG